MFGPLARKPDLVIGDAAAPYMRRWWITPWSNFERDKAKQTWIDKIKAKLPHVYYHEILRSDDDRALHDHPWWNVSIVLQGGYVEHMPAIPGLYACGWREHITRFRGRGSVVFRRANALHRLEVGAHAPRPTYTLFITGPVIREWGFACPKGWVNSKIFGAVVDGVTKVTRGCGES